MLAADGLPPRWLRLLALSGVVFALLFVVGWFTNGGLTPHYNEPDQEWTNWARDNQWSGRISAFLMLLAAFVFLHFLGAIRSVLGMAESRSRGAEQLARVAFGGGLTGMAGFAMASITLAAASTNGLAWRNGVRGLPRGGGTANAADESLRTLDRHRRAHRRGVFPHHVPDDPRRDDGRHGFFPGVVALIVWAAATSVARYRAVTT